MKKLFSLLFIAGALCMVSCGPTAEQKAKAEADAKHFTDSVMKAMTASMGAMDSTKTMTADSTKK